MADRDERTAREQALYIISVAADLAGVHAQTLRIYERKGLIEPARTPGGSRRYSDRDIALLRRIQELTNEGVSLMGVRRILELEDRLVRSLARIRELEAALAETGRGQRQNVVPAERTSRAVVRYRRDAR